MSDSSYANKRISDCILRRVEKEYPDDISMVLLYGSFINGTANPKSDADCYFIPKTERGYEFGIDFIIDSIGCDILSVYDYRDLTMLSNMRIK